MKKIFNYVLLVSIVSLAYMNNVYGEELEYSVGLRVNGDTTVVAGTESSVNVAIDSEQQINSCTFSVVADTGLEQVSKSGMNNFTLTENAGNLVLSKVNTETDFVSGQNILELRYKVNATGKITVKTIECSNALGNKSSAEDISVEFKIKEADEDTTLKNIVVTGGVLTPNFVANTTSYIIQLTEKQFSLALTANDENFQDKIVVTDSKGNVLDLSNIAFSDPSGQASMEITVKVNNKTEYKLLAKYEEKTLDNSISILKVAGKSVTIKEGVYDYTVTVSKTLERAKIDATLADPNNFSFASGNGPTMFELPSDKNIYPLMVEPKDPSSGAKGVTYTITIVREGYNQEENPKPSSSNQNTTTNPSTKGISMAVMAIVLIVSLMGSIYLYKKNLEKMNQN